MCVTIVVSVPFRLLLNGVARAAKHEAAPRDQRLPAVQVRLGRLPDLLLAPLQRDRYGNAARFFLTRF